MLIARYSAVSLRMPVWRSDGLQAVLPVTVHILGVSAAAGKENAVFKTATFIFHTCRQVGWLHVACPSQSGPPREKEECLAAGRHTHELSPRSL